MNKVMVGLMVALIGTSLMAADTNKLDALDTAFKAAGVIYNGRNYSAAVAAYEKIIKDFPNGNVRTLAYCQYYIGNSSIYTHPQDMSVARAAFAKVLANYPTSEISPLMSAKTTTAYTYTIEKNYAKAISEFEKAIAETSTAPIAMKAGAQGWIGDVFSRQKNYAEAVAAYEKVISNYPDISPEVLAAVSLKRANMLMLQGEQVKANSAYMDTVVNYGWTVKCGDEKSSIQQAFNKVNPGIIGVDEYKAFIQNAIKVIPATETNTPFLGRLKSELEKMK